LLRMGAYTQSISPVVKDWTSSGRCRYEVSVNRTRRVFQ
jgi:hypothetical protein